MKKGWTYKQLGDVCEILDFKRKPITKGKREPGSIPYYGATGCLDYVKDYIFDEKLVLLGEDGAKWGPGESSAYIISGKSWVNNHAHALRPKREIILDEILVYYLNYSNLQTFITGVTVPKLNQEKMRSIEVPVAPISEQERIVERLDAAFVQIDELKSNAERQLAEARALFQSALTQAMQPKPGWQEKTLKEITTKIGSGATPRGGKAVYIDNGVALIRSMNVHNGFFKYENLAHISDEAAYLLNGVELKQNDVLFNITGASIARCCVVPDDAIPARVNQHVSIIRPKPDIVDSRFLSYVLISKTHQKELLSIGLSGATRQALTKKDLENHVVYLPTPDEQRVILDYLDNYSLKVRDLEEISRKTAAECDAMKQALLRQIFD